MEKSKTATLIAFVMMLTMIFVHIAMPVQVHASDVPEITILLDRQPLEFDVAPIIVDDRTMIPFRAIFEAFGAEVFWDDENRQASAIHQGSVVTHIVLTIDQETAIVNGVTHLLDVAPLIYSSRTLVPLRFISESFGAEVGWNGYTRVVEITTPEITHQIVPVWEDVRDDFFGGSGFIDTTYFEYAIWEEDYSTWEWHPYYRNQIIGDSYFNGRGWRMSLESHQEMIAERDRILSQIITPNMSEFEMVRAAHRWVVENVSYNTDVWSWERFERTGNGRNPHPQYVRYFREDQMAWSAFILRTTVCAGYADALNYLLEPLGINSIYINGPMNNVTGGSHAWNIVQLGGAWFHIDPTWNRRYFGNQHLLVYDWFLISDSTMRRNCTRSWDTTIFPSAPRDFAFDRPEIIWDFNLNRFRHRTADDDRIFNVTTTSSHHQAGTVFATPSSAQSGQWVTIQANTNFHAGYTFSHWEVVSGNVTFHQQSWAWASFMMPASDVSIRAVFNQAQVHTVSVSTNNPQAGTANASMTNNVMPNQWVTLTAHPHHGFEFSHWEVISGEASLQGATSPWTNFLMPNANVSINAVFRELQTFSVTVTSSNHQAGTADASQTTGLHGTGWEWISLNAHPHYGFEFSHWEVISGDVVLHDTQSQWTQFLMPLGNVSIRAVFRELQIFSVTVTSNNQQAGFAEASQTTGLHGTGWEWITLTAHPHHGFELSHWEVVSGDAILFDAQAIWTQFLMPSSNVSIRAVFREIQTFSVNVSVSDHNAGTATAWPSTSVAEWDWVTLNANPNWGYEFSHWEVVSGSAIIQDPTSPWTQFNMPSGNVSIIAIFRSTAFN